MRIGGSDIATFLFLHCNFPIFIKMGKLKKWLKCWIYDTKKRGRNLDVSFLSSKFRPLSIMVRITGLEPAQYCYH